MTRYFITTSARMRFIVDLASNASLTEPAKTPLKDGEQGASHFDATLNEP